MVLWVIGDAFYTIKNSGKEKWTCTATATVALCVIWQQGGDVTNVNVQSTRAAEPVINLSEAFKTADGSKR